MLFRRKEPHSFQKGKLACDLNQHNLQWIRKVNNIIIDINIFFMDSRGTRNLVCFALAKFMELADHEAGFHNLICNKEKDFVEDFVFFI